jgi:hydroxymethylglutaryl-CoA synthase
VSSLLRKYNIDPKSIGRLEVGTESPIDKAKSVKTVLTQLFEPAGNTSLEGVDTVNACYGGTSALFNAVNWVESRSWDGRDAIVVASDIALYREASSRPTGGAGCVAMLVGPGAVLSLEPSLRGTFMTNAYDFYKPDTKVEFPVVNGHESIRAYVSALDGCYKRLRERVETTRAETNGYQTNGDAKNLLDRFDYMAFHTPNCKLVSKSYGRLMYNDFLLSTDEKTRAAVPSELMQLSYEESLKSKELEKLFVTLSRDRFQARVEPCIAAPTLCGNMYTASLYCSLISLISNIDPKEAMGKTIGMFSVRNQIIKFPSSYCLLTALVVWQWNRQQSLCPQGDRGRQRHGAQG